MLNGLVIYMSAPLSKSSAFEFLVQFVEHYVTQVSDLEFKPFEHTL